MDFSIFSSILVKRLYIFWRAIEINKKSLILVKGALLFF